MKRLFVLMGIVFTLVLGLSFALAGDVPTAVTASDFGGATASPEASWFWQFISSDSVLVGIWAVISFVITKIASSIQTILYKRGNAKLSEATRKINQWCLDAAQNTWNEYARELKKKNANGKLTEEQKKIAMDTAVEFAWTRIKQDGLDKAGQIAKDSIPVLIEQAINWLKGDRAKAEKGIADALAPLPDLSR